MGPLRVVLKQGESEDSHSWQLSDGAAPAAEGAWAVTSLPGRILVQLSNAGNGNGSWLFRLSAETIWQTDLTVELHLTLGDLQRPDYLLWADYHGILARYRCQEELCGSFLGAGRAASEALGLPLDGQRLALPLAVLETPRGMLLAGTDPTFSTTIVVRTVDQRASLIFSWRMLAAAGAHGEETRRIFVQPVAGAREALDRWFATATPDVPPGPAWLHDIALQDYDYLSKNGQGWFADIDAASALIAPRDRHRALFCLHGWYDRVGRYCFDPTTGRLDKEWIAFPHINDPALHARTIGTPVTPGLPTPGSYAFRNLDRYRPVALTWDDMRARLRYARDRGFRTAVYAITGLQDAGSVASHVADGTGLAATGSELWIGPDLIGESYLCNPLHADVLQRFLSYIQALLSAVGDLTDALVMDEAYYIGYGRLGPAACPGYADRAQARLIQEITALCHRHRSDLAFLTADLLGHPSMEHRAFPYSLFADGIYQDSWCWPQTWDVVRLPTWRNVAWSCNWAPVTNLAFTRWGVLAHGAPVAVSNGCFGDDVGLAEMDQECRNEIGALWQQRRNQERERSVAVVDIRRR